MFPPDILMLMQSEDIASKNRIFTSRSYVSPIFSLLMAPHAA
jgi:hypothetical protein